METSEFTFNFEGNLYFVKLTYGDYYIKIALTNGADFWTGEYEKADMSIKAGEMHMSLREYFETTKEGITAGSFTYKIDNDVFIWSKSDEILKGITVKYGMITMAKSSTDGYKFLIEELASKNQSLRQLEEKQEKKIEKLTKDLVSTQGLLETAIADKNASEAKLMSGFLKLLNSKKAKIKSLTDFHDSMK